MLIQNRGRISAGLALTVLISLLAGALYGCGGSGGGTAAGPSGSGGTTAAGGGSDATQPLSGQHGTVVVQHNLSELAKREAMAARRASKSVGPAAVQFVYSFLGAAGSEIAPQRTHPRQPSHTLTGVPIEVVRIHVAYNNASGQTLAFAEFPVSVTANQSVTVAAGALSGAFTVELVNDSGVSDDNVFVVVAANPTAPSPAQGVSGVALVNTLTNQFTPFQREQQGHGTRLSAMACSATVASKTRKGAFNKLYSFTTENLISGRVYVTYGDNALFTFDSKRHIFESPSADANFRWDVMELTTPAAAPYPICYADLTSIQFLGMPMQLETFADADPQRGLAQQAVNSPAGGADAVIQLGNVAGIKKGATVVVGDGQGSEQATVLSVTTTAPSSVTVSRLSRSYSRPYVTLDVDSALQTRTFHVSTPTILNALWSLTTSTDNRMQWAFQAVGDAPAPQPSPSATPVPVCSPGASPSPTATPSPGPNVAQRLYSGQNLWLQPSQVGKPGAFLRVQGPQTTVSEPWTPAASPDPTKIVAGDPSSFETQRPYRAYPYPTFAGYVSSMVGSCYSFNGANSCGGTATGWHYGGTVTQAGKGYYLTLEPLEAMSPAATLGCGPGSDQGVPLPVDLPVRVFLHPNDDKVQGNDLDFVVYSTPGGVFETDVPCNLVGALDNSVYANIADNALAGLQFGYVNGVSSPNNGTVWFAGFPAFPPFGAARATNDGLYNPYAAVIYNSSDAYGFPYSDRIAQFNPLVTTANSGASASSALRVTLLNDLKPDAPSGLRLVAGSYDPGKGATMTVSWNAATRYANSGEQATSYTVTLTDGLPTVPAPPRPDLQTQTVSGTQAVFSDLRPGVTYTAWVVATYADGTVSARSAQVSALTAGPSFISYPSGMNTQVKYSISYAWDPQNLSSASDFTLNVAGIGSYPMSSATPVTIPVTGVVGTTYIPFTVTTTNAIWPAIMAPPQGWSGGTIVDAGAFVVTVAPDQGAPGTRFEVSTVYVTDGSPMLLPLTPQKQPIVGPYNDDGTAIAGGNGPLVLSVTLQPGQGGAGAADNVSKVTRPVVYPVSSPTPLPSPYTCPSYGYTPPAPSATPCPNLTFTPAAGVPGTQVTIKTYVNGTLAGQNAVLFNGVPAASYSAVPDPAPGSQLTVITATVPYNPTAGGPIEIITNLGETVSSTPFSLDLPTFTVSTSGANIGQSITLTAQNGFNFQAAASATPAMTPYVQYASGCDSGTDKALQITPTTITSTVPNNAGVGPCTLTVNLPGGLVATLDPTQTFTVTSPKFSVSPSQISPGQTVTLTPAQGNVLSDIQIVTFAGSTANPPATAAGGGAYTVTVPSDAQTGYVTVKEGAYLSPSTSSNALTIVVPTFTCSPSTVGYGETVTLTSATQGAFQVLSGVLSALFGGTSGVPSNVATPGPSPYTTATVAVPIGATTGTVYVKGSQAGTLQSSAPLTIVHPTVSSFTPSSGGTGTAVTISGPALASAQHVFFNTSNTGGGVPATSFSHDAGTGNITAVVPALASGSYYIQCQDATGQGVVSTSTFTVP